jgi:UDP-GlcNAc:undecaprenyl-phosphate GlcNAc-1-phosphate transferase
MAEPDERRSHPVATPDVGGIAFFIGLLASLGLASQMDRFSSLFQNNSELIGVLIAAVVIFVLGIFDDIREVSAPMKVTGVVVAALALVAFPFWMCSFCPMTGFRCSQFFGYWE